jgi:hypothetical protein
MADQPSNDSFISYRRDVADTLARALWQDLTQHGIDVFLDVESIRGAGQFESIVFGQIAARPYFILTLTPGTLERCSEPDDLLRREIEHAVAEQRLIVPAYTPKFDFADCDRFLPGDLGRTLRGNQAQELPHQLFRPAVQQLVDEFLLPVAIPTTPTPATEQLVVDRMRQQVEAVPTVTPDQLSAQEMFERASSRPEDDVLGKIADYSEVIRLDPTYASAFKDRAIVRGDNGDLDGAIADFDEAIRLERNYMYFVRAVTFGLRAYTRREQGDLDGAIADYNEAIGLDPTQSLFFRGRATARTRKGDRRGAKADMKEANRIDLDRRSRGL